MWPLNLLLRVAISVMLKVLQPVCQRCSLGGEIGRHIRLKICRLLNRRAGSIPARGTNHGSSFMTNQPHRVKKREIREVASITR